MAADHDALVEDWQRNAARDEERNFRFLRSLKMVSEPDRIDALAGDLRRDAFDKIDCTRCASSCKTMQPGLTDEDIDRIAARLGLTREAFISAYLEQDPEEEGHRMKVMPCPFLGPDDRSTIYAATPQACREFPHTDKEGFIGRSYLHTANTLTCPAVFYIVKRLGQRR